MTTDLTIYCYNRPKKYLLSSCSWHLDHEKWEAALEVVSNVLGYAVKDTSWDGEDYHHYSTESFKLTPKNFEKMLIKLSCRDITFSVF